VTRIALATCASLPLGDPDDAGLPQALGDATWAVWDDPSVDWTAFDRVVLRSTWDYAPRRDAFVTWADAVGPSRLVNPPEVVRWNTDKRYLTDLPQVVPTTFVAPGEQAQLPATEFVVKPTVSAGSRDTARFAPGDAARATALIAGIHAGGRTAMVQPYVRSVDERGETALIFFAGRYSHAIRKGPILRRGENPTTDLFAAEQIAPAEPTAAERALADLTLAAVRERFAAAPAYARVDLVQDGDGSVALLELELVEPSLFFSHAPGAMTRFAAAVL
jgi:O-ureido-D-serine cyclo-ligase